MTSQTTVPWWPPLTGSSPRAEPNAYTGLESCSLCLLMGRWPGIRQRPARFRITLRASLIVETEPLVAEADGDAYELRHPVAEPLGHHTGMGTGKLRPMRVGVGRSR